MTVTAQRDLGEMMSWRSVRYVGGVLAFSLLCWWTAPRNSAAAGLFLWAGLWTFMSWLVRDRDADD